MRRGRAASHSAKDAVGLVGAMYMQRCAAMRRGCIVAFVGALCTQLSLSIDAERLKRWIPCGAA